MTGGKIVTFPKPTMHLGFLAIHATKIAEMGTDWKLTNDAARSWSKQMTERLQNLLRHCSQAWKDMPDWLQQCLNKNMQKSSRRRKMRKRQLMRRQLMRLTMRKRQLTMRKRQLKQRQLMRLTMRKRQLMMRKRQLKKRQLTMMMMPISRLRGTRSSTLMLLERGRCSTHGKCISPTGFQKVNRNKKSLARW